MGTLNLEDCDASGGWDFDRVSVLVTAGIAALLYECRYLAFS